jgi:hypothetical protein
MSSEIVMPWITVLVGIVTVEKTVLLAVSVVAVVFEYVEGADAPSGAVPKSTLTPAFSFVSSASPACDWMLEARVTV